MEQYKLYNAEYKFMSIVWENEPINSTQLVKLCNEKLKWKKSTTYTVLRKLKERNIIKNENAVVTSLVKSDAIEKYESKVVVDSVFNGSLPHFLTAFLSQGKISKKEAEKLKAIIEEATE
jgi:predicted transcriptional regulator